MTVFTPQGSPRRPFWPCQNPDSSSRVFSILIKICQGPGESWDSDISQDPVTTSEKIPRCQLFLSLTCSFSRWHRLSSWPLDWPLDLGRWTGRHSDQAGGRLFPLLRVDRRGREDQFRERAETGAVWGTQCGGSESRDGRTAHWGKNWSESEALSVLQKKWKEQTKIKNFTNKCIKKLDSRTL